MPGELDTSPIAARVRHHVAPNGVGGVAWALSVGSEVASGAAGWLDPRAADRPMPKDAIFRIASVTKPIAAIAALQLVDDGLIGLDDPVDDALPELAGRRVLVDPDGPVDGPTVPAERPVTLRDLLSFRCGDGMDMTAFEQPVLQRLWELEIGPGPTSPMCPPDEFLQRLASVPMAEQPGTRWRYHVGSDIVSVLIERLRGEHLDTVLARDVLAPAGMVDTAFWVGPDRMDRFGVARMGDEGAGDGGRPSVWDEPDGRWSSPPVFRSGAAGLVSTTADLLAFGRVFLNRGDGPRGRLLSPELFAEMTRDHLTDEQRVAAHIDDDVGSIGWGLGIGVRRLPAPAGWPSVGTLGWDGGLGSRLLVDPEQEVCAVILSTDAFDSPAAPAVIADFTEAVAETLAG